MARAAAFIALPLGVAPLVALRRGRPVEPQPFEDASDSGSAHGHIAVALQIHRDLRRPEVVGPAQVDDLLHDFDVGGMRTHLGPPEPIPQPVKPPAW
jgi:hypothetical protein